MLGALVAHAQGAVAWRRATRSRRSSSCAVRVRPGMRSRRRTRSHGRACSSARRAACSATRTRPRWSSTRRASIFERLGATPDLARLDAPVGRDAHGLSRRELEVLRLVARARATARSPRRSSSASTRSRGTSRTSSPSSGCRLAPLRLRSRSSTTSFEQPSWSEMTTTCSPRVGGSARCARAPARRTVGTKRRGGRDGSAIERFETVIIGGGQAGLAAGYHLARRGRSFVILDASERIGDCLAQALGLAAAVFAGALRRASRACASRRAARRIPTTHEMADYLEAYAHRFELPVRTGTLVGRLSKDGDRYVVTAGEQTFEADNVVVATGVMQEPFVPSFAVGARPAHQAAALERLPEPAQLQEGACSWSAQATPGADIAYEAATEHETILSGRTPVRSRPASKPGAGALGFRLLFFAGRTSSRWTLRSGARCARTSGTEALRCCGTDEGPARRRGRARARADRRRPGRASRCSRTVASSTSRT